MQNAYVIRLYIGRRYGQNSPYAGEVIPREFFDRIIAYAETNIACVVLDAETGRVQGGTTRYSANGQWLGIPEDTIIIETWVSQHDLLAVYRRMKETAQFVAAALEQDSVGMTAQAIRVRFVSPV